MQQKCLCHKKIRRPLPYIDATVQVQFIHYFDRCGSILLPIVFLVISNSLLNTWRAKMRYNGERIEATHSRSISHATNRLCCGESTHALATKTVPALQSTTSPLEKANLRVMSFIHNMFFWSEWGEGLELDALEPVWETLSSCGRREKFDIWFLHPKYVDFMSSGAS